MVVELVNIFPDLARPKFRIYAMGENSTFPLIDFIENLTKSNSESSETLLAILEHVAANGPITNDKRKSRILDPKHKIYEQNTAVRETG